MQIIQTIILMVITCFYSLSLSYKLSVNRETGEVLREREWSDIECEWLYNEEYRKAVK